jgi:predicted nucleotide-binding protein
VKLEEAISRLQAAGLEVLSKDPIQHGHKICLNTGAIVNVFHTGNVNVQGRNQAEAKLALGIDDGETAVAISRTGRGGLNNKVFVVYGHETGARTQLEAMLRRWGLEPLILDQLPSEGQTIIEKLESYTTSVNFAVVLATPDDQGHRSGHSDEIAYRARQNVVLELGMLLSRLGRKRVAILLKQQENMERPSDIQGLIYIPFKQDLEKEAGLLLAKEMHAQGYQIDVARI